MFKKSSGSNALAPSKEAMSEMMNKSKKKKNSNSGTKNKLSMMFKKK